MSFDEFDDLEVDENAIYNQKIAQLQAQLQNVTARLSFPPYMQIGVAGYELAKHYGKSQMAGVLGGIAGAWMFKNRKISDTDRQILLKKVQVLRSQIEQLKKQRDAGVNAAQGIMSAEQLAEYDYPKYEFSDRWTQFFGHPSINAHYMVFGLPKSGKSTFCLHFAKYLADNHGSVLYVASEEGFSQTLQNKVKNFKLNSKNMAFSNFREYDKIKDIVGNFDFVFIDSVNYIQVTPEEIEEMKEANPNLSVVTIQQATKEGDYKGETAYAHNCDSIVKIVDGIATQQGRFQEQSQMEVFPQRGKKEVIQYEEND